MNNDSLESELLDEELSDFFNDDNNVPQELKEPKEEIKEVVEVLPKEPIIAPKLKKDEDKAFNPDVLDELLDEFNVKKDYSKVIHIKDAKEMKDKIENIKKNLDSLKAVYGDKVTDKIEQLLANEEELDKLIEEFIARRDDMLAKMRAVENATRGVDDNEDIKRLFMRFVAMHPEVDVVFLYIAIDNMIERRNERLAESEGSGQGSAPTKKDEPVIDPNAFAVGYVVGQAIVNLNQEDVNKYLQSFYKKIELIEKETGVKLDDEFIQFFTSPQYILSSSYELPPLMKEENFNKLKETWSMPLLINDTRQEEMDKELYKANESIKSMETFYAGYGDTRDNGVIEALKGLSSDVEEEKKRVSEDIEFFKNEKIKEKVEVAILASISGNTKDPKIDTLGQLLKESISSRIDYMKDEENLRKVRKEINDDKEHKDNEVNHRDYFDALQGVNKAVEERREQRALGYVSFVPEAVKQNRFEKQEREKNSEMSKDERSISGQDMSIGGRQKVLTYVNNYNNVDNNAA